MYDYVYEEEQYKGFTIKILQDTDPVNPIVDWDVFGTIAYKHRRYSLGTEEISGDIIEWLEGELGLDEKGIYTNERKTELENMFFKKYVGFPFSLYDHSGITISEGISRGWDRGQVGYFYASKEDILKEFGGKYLTKKLKEKALNILRMQLKKFDNYLTGEVYSWAVEDDEGVLLDGCSGYFGDDSIKYAIQEAQSRIDYLVKDMYKRKNKTLKTLITNHVPLYKREQLLEAV